MDARCEISLDDIEKVVDCKEVHEKIEGLQVFLKLVEFYGDDYCPDKDLILMNAWQGVECSSIIFIQGVEDDELHDAIEEQFIGIGKSMEKIFIDFKTKTNITVWWDYDWERDYLFYELKCDDVVQFTPKVKVLDNIVIDVELVHKLTS